MTNPFMACPFYMAAWLEKVNCSAAESFMIMLFENYFNEEIKISMAEVKKVCFFVFSCIR